MLWVDSAASFKFIELMKLVRLTFSTNGWRSFSLKLVLSIFFPVDVEVIGCASAALRSEPLCVCVLRLVLVLCDVSGLMDYVLRVFVIDIPDKVHST